MLVAMGMGMTITPSAAAVALTDDEAITADSESAFNLGARKITPLHGAARDRAPVMVRVDLSALHRLARYQRAQIVRAGIGIARSAVATWPAMARQLGGVDRGQSDAR